MFGDSDGVIAEAVKLRDKLLEVAKELRIQGKMARSTSGKTLAAMDAKACDDSARMLEKLGTEVTRLRLGILTYCDGRMEERGLRNMAKNWNGDETEGV